MVFGIIGILLLAGAMLGKIGWGWGVLGAIFLYWPASRFWTKYKAASNAVLARYTFDLLSETDRKKVLAAVSAIMSNAKYPSQDPVQELKSMAPEQRYGFIALGMAHIGITPKIGGGWYEVHNPYTEILGAHREIAFVKYQIRLRYGVDVNFGDVVASTVQRSGLVAQDLAAVQHSKQPALPRDNDTLYRQARDVFENSGKTRNGDVVDNPAIFSAFKTFQQLANENYGKAYYPLSILYNRYQRVKDQTRANQYSQMAFDWCFANQVIQDAELWCDLAKMYATACGVELDVMQATYWLRKAADQGYTKAQFNLGVMYDCGQGDPQEGEEGLYWICKAAEKGNSDAQFYLGDKYARGQGVPQDGKEAVKWYRLSADQGKTIAKLYLGMMYARGQNVTQDYEEAVYWYRKAAEQGDTTAQSDLGKMYELGQAVPKDDEEAEKWNRWLLWSKAQISYK